MARQLHHIKNTNKYALWSTVVDDYVTDWLSKDEIEKIWVKEKVKTAKKEVHAWMEQIDEDFETGEEAEAFRKEYAWGGRMSKETAMAGAKMARDPKIITAINQLDKALKKYNRYFIFYTHRFEQGDTLKGNILITPNDKRFDRIELLGLIVDILRDYSSDKNWTWKGSVELKFTIGVLKDIYEGKIDD